jgi:ribokinase
VVVTLGAAGALVVAADRPAVAIAATSVEPVDTTGAGDAFNGALAAGLAAGRPLDEAARLAVAAAGLSTTRPGARGGLPTATELQAHLHRVRNKEAGRTVLQSQLSARDDRDRPR